MQSGKTKFSLSSWYDQFKWIHFCQSGFKVYCYYCVKASGATWMKNIRVDQVFVISGFSNWSKTIERFKDHEYSIAHKISLMILVTSKVLTNGQLVREDENNKKNIKNINKAYWSRFNALQYLVCQDIVIPNSHVHGSNLSVSESCNSWRIEETMLDWTYIAIDKSSWMLYM